MTTGQQDNRRTPGRPPIPLDRIVTTALEIVDEQGADALSMRTLAHRLNSGTATLYRHFAGRADLVAHVVDRVFGAIELDVAKFSTMSWQEACKSACHSMFDGLRRHRNVTTLLVESVPIGPNALAARERMIAFLLGNGFPPALAARSYATLARYILGFAVQLNSGHGDLDDGNSAARHGFCGKTRHVFRRNANRGHDSDFLNAFPNVFPFHRQAPLFLATCSNACERH